MSLKGVSGALPKFRPVATVLAVTESISVAEAAQALGVTPRRVRMWLADGALAGDRLSGGWKVDPLDVARLQAERSTTGSRPAEPSALEFAAALAEIERLSGELDKERRSRMLLAAQVTELTKMLQEMAADQETLLGIPAVGGAWPRSRPMNQSHERVTELLGPASTDSAAGRDLGAPNGGPAHDFAGGPIREYGELR